MMPQEMMGPPAVNGVTEGIPRPDPMRMLAAMMNPASAQTGMQHVLAALASLKQAGKADPRLQDQVAEAMQILMQGQANEDTNDSSRLGEPGSGPMMRGGMMPCGPR